MLPSSSVMVLALLPAALVWGIWWVRVRPRARQVARGLALALWVAVMAGLLYSNLPIDSRLIADTRSEPGQDPGYLQLVPFRSIWAALNGGSVRDVEQIVGNAVLLCPVGVLLAGLMPTKRQTMRVGSALGLSIALGLELSQLLANAAFGFVWKIVDVDDVMLNATGFMLAWALYVTAQRRAGAPAPAQPSGRQGVQARPH